MAQLLQVHYLSIGALTIRQVSEGIEYAFESAYAIGLLVGALPDLPIGTLAYFLVHVVALNDADVHVVVHDQLDSP